MTRGVYPPQYPTEEQGDCMCGRDDNPFIVRGKGRSRRTGPRPFPKSSSRVRLGQHNDEQWDARLNLLHTWHKAEQSKFHAHMSSKRQTATGDYATRRRAVVATQLVSSSIDVSPQNWRYGWRGCVREPYLTDWVSTNNHCPNTGWTHLTEGMRPAHFSVRNGLCTSNVRGQSHYK